MPKVKRKLFNKLYIPFWNDETFEWRWEEAQVLIVDNLWTAGLSIQLICERFKHRDPDEVMILIMDRIRQGHIDHRPGGFLGTIRK